MGMIAIIPAKTNSRRCPNKNFKRFAGSTLTERAVQCAMDSHLFDSHPSGLDMCYDDIVITSDGELSEVTDHYVIVMLRNKLLCEDGVETASVVFDVLATFDYHPESFCVLNPTSPLHTPEMLQDIAGVFERTGSCVMTYCNGRHDGTAIFLQNLGFSKMSRFSSHEEGDIRDSGDQFH